MGRLKTVFLALVAATSVLMGCSNGDDGPCAGLNCGDHGTCDTSTDTCKCDANYAGSQCDFCADGYHDVGGQCMANSCNEDSDCDDGLGCNGQEKCIVGECLSGTAIECGPNASCTEPSGACQCDEGFVLIGENCVTGDCETDSDCDDGLFCNGAEECSDGTCVSHPFDCMENGHCDESAQACICDKGYTMEQDQCIAVLGIAGSWIDDWGSFHDITDATWVMDASVFHIASFDASADFLVAQNDGQNRWSPGLWSRFDWTFDESGDLYYCQIAYAAASESEALASDSADRTDLSAGCAGFGWSRLSERLDITGIWEDSWGYEQDISQSQWKSGDSIFHTSLFDNEQQYLLAQNDSNNQWNADKWSRFDWTQDAVGQLYYCQIAYDKDSEQDAMSATGADRQDLDTGCAGFSWSALYTRPAIVGTWLDDWGYEQNISRDSWTSGDSLFHITRVNNHLGYAVAHNDPDNQWNPGMWSRFDWTWDNDGELYYCQVVFDANSADAAEAVKSADRTDLQGGCSGFGWSHLSLSD